MSRLYGPFPCSISAAFCSRCWEHLHSPSHKWCRPCNTEHKRRTRKSYAMLSVEEKKKQRCRARTRSMIRRGILTRKPCEFCRDENSQAHHSDYSDPRNVHWLCFRCHRRHHKNQQRAQR